MSLEVKYFMLVIKINKIVLVILFLLSLFMAQGYSAPKEETITITTYYPSPKGVYKSLRLFPSSGSRVNDPCLPAQEGEMFYNKDDHTPFICSDRKWKALPGTGGAPAGIWQKCSGEGEENSICTDYSIAIKGVSEEALPYGQIDVKDVWLRDAYNGAGVWAAEAMRAGVWDIRNKDIAFGNTVLPYFVLFPKNGGNVGIGTQGPSAKLTIQGSGDSSATASLRMRQDNDTCREPVGTALLVRDDGRVGILLGDKPSEFFFDRYCRRNEKMDYLLGDGNPPLASLHLRGKVRIEDEQPMIDKTDMILTSDANGLATWKPQEDNRALRGLYGYCRQDRDWCGESELPASCGADFICHCPAGYERLLIDGGDEDTYSCYKIP